MPNFHSALFSQISNPRRFVETIFASQYFKINYVIYRKSFASFIFEVPGELSKTVNINITVMLLERAGCLCLSYWV